jgi:AcrR family transcriptional regulator
MQTHVSKRDSIIESAAKLIEDGGLDALTVGAVAGQAQVSTALVHYHFDTKGALVVAAAAALALERRARLLGAISGSAGLGAVDGLWEAVWSRVVSGSERAWAQVVLAAAHEGAIATVVADHRTDLRAALTSRLPGLFRELGVRADAEESALMLATFLDGLALGHPREAPAVRAAYDAFWLTLLAAGQRRR